MHVGPKMLNNTLILRLWFPQVEEALTKLKENEIQIGMSTSKTNEEMENEFEHFGLSKLFDISVTAY